MTAFSIVRFRVKSGHDQEFLDAHRNVRADWQGLRRFNIARTGEHNYCIIAEWSDMDAPHSGAATDDRDARYVPPHT